MLRKAILPVAGLGTRFLPATKASPKEMLPIVDKPLIQYAVEEAIASGIEHIIFVTSGGKHAIENHFDTNFELETKLAACKQFEKLKAVQATVPYGVSYAYVRQQQPLGLGHAVLCAQPLIGDEPFAVLLADELIDAKQPCLQQMRDAMRGKNDSMIAVQEMPRSEVDKYGVVDADPAQLQDPIRGIVEKPTPAMAPSTLAVTGRYILQAKIFDYLASTQPGAGGEIQLTDAIARLLKTDPVYAYPFKGTRFDCGSKLGYLKATIHFGLKHPDIGRALQNYLHEIA